MALLPSYYEDTTWAQRWQELQCQVGTGVGGLARPVDAGEMLWLCQGPVSLIEESLFTQAWPTGRPWRTETEARMEGGSDCD